MATIPLNENAWRERVRELGDDPAAKSPPSGKWGMKCIVVSTLPTAEEMEDNALYFVKA